MIKKPLTVLTDLMLAEGLQTLASRDADLADVLVRLGPPPLWAKEPGFPTLIQIILEQQVSLVSARATFDRLLAEIDPLTPEGLLELDDDTLKQVGFSRQKMHYGRLLAQALIEGQLDLTGLHTQSDIGVRESLMAIKGIGPWTAEVYLLMALRRPDAWPGTDLALAIAVQQVKRLDQRPNFAEMDEIGRPWQPWRGVAARLLWHHYLNR